MRRNVNFFLTFIKKIFHTASFEDFYSWKLFFLLICFLFINAPLPSQNSKPVVSLHYLGHSSFILQFDNGVSVLTDYGISNSYGLSYTIYNLGDLKPEIVTYSHDHEDHFGGKIPPGVKFTLTNKDSLDYKGIKIRPIPNFEQTVEKSDNSSYLFQYKGFKIIHFGDMQALIANIEKPGIRIKIKELYPDNYDLVLLPIGYVLNFLNGTESVLELLHPKRTIPMHYWNKDDKMLFLSTLESWTKKGQKIYNVEKNKGPKYSFTFSDTLNGRMKIINLEPAVYTISTNIEKK